MSDVDVSVVIPCYNVEQYLDQAITSAEQNDRIRLEIICVNDGSPDGSLAIMREHERRDPRVRVIDKPNGGYGNSMNRGFDEARGTYVAILEPDDWVEPHMYDDLFEFGMSFSLETPPDIIKTPYTRIWMPGTRKEHRYNCSYYMRTAPEVQPFTLKDAPRLIQHHPSIWSAIYRKEFLDENGIRFMEVPGAGWVDNPFLIETLCQAKAIVYKEQPYYNYREDLPTSSSARRTTTLPVERWHNMADVLDRLGVDDPGIRTSFGVIAFRYAGGLIDAGALEDPETKQLMASMFERMGRDQILAIPNVAPDFKRLALELIGEEVPEIDNTSYRDALVNEFFYTVKTNGIAFGFERFKLFVEQKLSFSKANPNRTRSASI